MLNSKGMTLIEILIAISLIAILSSVSFKAFQGLRPSLKLSSATRDLITDIRYVQELAVTEQVLHGICFFTLEDKYQLIRYGTDEEILQEKILPSGISFQEINGFSGNCVKFNPYGAVKKSGNIILINQKSETKTIEVRPSGFSKIQG